jgi:hypothetical protein
MPGNLISFVGNIDGGEFDIRNLSGLTFRGITIRLECSTFSRIVGYSLDETEGYSGSTFL